MSDPQKTMSAYEAVSALLMAAAEAETERYPDLPPHVSLVLPAPVFDAFAKDATTAEIDGFKWQSRGGKGHLFHLDLGPSLEYRSWSASVSRGLG